MSLDGTRAGGAVEEVVRPFGGGASLAGESPGLALRLYSSASLPVHIAS